MGFLKSQRSIPSLDGFTKLSVDEKLEQEQCEPLRDDMSFDSEPCPREVLSQRKGHSRPWACMVLLLVNSVFLLSSICLTLGTRSFGGRNEVLRRVSAFSPIFDEVDIDLSMKKFNATLLDPKFHPIYRQPPSPEVDAAWKRITNVNPIAITKEDVIKLGKDPSISSKWPESFGFGSEAYIGRVDVFHQIHCLDSLRREAFFHHYYGHKWPDHQTSELHQTHLSHCVYLLLQNLMCQANVGVYTHVWADANYNAFPDFSLNQKCRNFDAVLDWQEKNSVDVDVFAALRKPAEHEAIVMNRKFKELFGWFTEHDDDGIPDGKTGSIG